jgi:hypothetical protein
MGWKFGVIVEDDDAAFAATDNADAIAVLYDLVKLFLRPYVIRVAFLGGALLAAANADRIAGESVQKRIVILPPGMLGNILPGRIRNLIPVDIWPVGLDLIFKRCDMFHRS